MAITRVRHSINGKVCGMFYSFDDGRNLYLAWRSGEKSKSLSVKKNAWCLDVGTLREAKHRGCTAIGIAHRIGKNVLYYVTNMDDYLNLPSEAHTNGVAPQRSLSRDKFRVNTAMSYENIEKAVKIR